MLLSPSSSRNSDLALVTKPAPSHIRSGSSSTRSASRSSWMGTVASLKPLLDVVTESRDEDQSGDECSGENTGVDRPRKRRRAPEVGVITMRFYLICSTQPLDLIGRLCALSISIGEGEMFCASRSLYCHSFNFVLS